MKRAQLGVGVVAVLSMLVTIAPVHALGGFGTGVLFMYSDSGCTSQLSQAGGNQGYVLSGTTVYLKIKQITEVSPPNQVSIYLFYTDPTTLTSYTATLGPASLSAAGNLGEYDTACMPWSRGSFSQGTVNIACGATGNVKYGQATDGSKYNTLSNGGSDGGHFYGAGTKADGTCSSVPVPEFPVVVSVLAVILVPLVFLLRRHPILKS